MDPLSNLLADHRTVIIDGSFGFQLKHYMNEGFDEDPLWSAKALYSNPDAVIEVHMDYIKAGAAIIETNSYQASEKGFMKYLNLSKEDSFNIIKKSAELAKIAIKKCKEEGILEGRNIPLVAGSIGPYGAYLHDGSEYNGKYTDHIGIEELREYHKSRMSALIEGGVDLLAIETIPSKKEAELLVDMIKDYPEIKAWLSFSCKSDGISTAHGDNFVEAVRSCYEQNPDQLIAVGVNCIQPSAVEPLLSKVNVDQEKKIPLIVYANSGEKYDEFFGWDNRADALEPYIPVWLDLGVKYVGGCCRVCADYIVKIKEEVEKWEKKHL
ncbi:hypothetical protein WA026_009967 [Henosepilachna vigintioctopunctata]|uniref:Hcy-binding domain-containing protein n=1 Tax=Henosepilachna vigintioctopunctata TaxID=420089 RepID=A0AAW1TSF8_9CUCU